MKKNIMMRLAAFLLVAVLLSTSIIGGTWAKYTTSSDQTTEIAKVAKWGVTITANAADNDEYQTLALSSEETAVLVTDDAKLLAPGSGVKFGTFTVSGKPEVDVEVKYSAVVDFGAAWDADYMPLVFKVGTETLTFRSENDSETIAQFAARIEAAVAAFSVKLDADATNDLDTKAEQYKLAVSCYWAFESGEDAKDTALGNAAAATVNVKLTCTVSQVDQ